VSTSLSTVRLSAVDVVFMDQPALQRSGIAGILNPNSNPILAYQVQSDIRKAMSQLRDGVKNAFVVHGIQGQSYLASDTSQMSKPISHRIVVSVISARAGAQTATEVSLKIEIFEAGSRSLLWQGKTSTIAARVGWSVKAGDESILERGMNFGEGIVRALNETGLRSDMAQASSK
jgi:hypothetical protein